MHLLYHPWSMIFKCQWPGSPCWGSPMIYAKYIFSPYVFIYIIYTFTPPILIPNWKARRLRLEIWSAGGVACRAPIHNGARTRNLNSWDPGLETTLHPPPPPPPPPIRGDHCGHVTSWPPITARAPCTCTWTELSVFAGKIFKLTVFVRGCGRERGGQLGYWMRRWSGGLEAFCIIVRHYRAHYSGDAGCRAASYTVHRHSHAH